MASLKRPVFALAFLVSSSVLAAVGCGDDDGDESSYMGNALSAIRAHCEQRVESERTCESSCTLAGLNAKCPASDSLWSDPELDSFHTCRNACAVARMCEARGKIYDCACSEKCASERSKRLQGLMAHDADCKIDLAECQ